MNKWCLLGLIILNCCVISEPKAETEIIKTWSCGKTCTATLDTAGKLTISGTGDMYNYPYTLNTPVFAATPWGEYYNQITSVDVENGITSIGERAFKGLNITSISLGETIKRINDAALSTTTQLNSILIPDSVEYIGWYAIDTDTNSSLNEIVISDNLKPENVSKWDKNAFHGTAVQNIRCIGQEDKCREALARYIPTSSGGKCTIDCFTDNLQFSSVNTEQLCNSINAYYWSGENCKKRPTDGSSLTCVNGYALAENNCIKDCTALGQVEYNGECLDEYPFSRKHWTPSEAAKWLNEDDNDVILTFKK